MANPDHIALIDMGRERWNEWRNNSHERPDLRQAPLSRISVVGYNFAGADCRGALFNKSDLSGCNFGGADLGSSDLRGAQVTGAEFSNVSFSLANLSELDLSGMTFDATNFAHATLDNARFNNSKFRFCEFDSANLRDADFSGSSLYHTGLRNSDIRGANFYKAKLESVDLTESWIWNTRTTDWELSTIVASVVKTGQQGEKDQFAQGQFERIFATRTLKVHLPTRETPFEISNLPNLIYLLGTMKGAFSVTFDEAGDNARAAAIKIEPRTGADALEVEQLNDVVKGLQIILSDSELALESERKRVEALNSKLLDFFFMSGIPAGPNAIQQEVESLTVTVFDMTGSSKFSEEENLVRTTKFWGVGLALVTKMGARHVNTWGDSLIACFKDTRVALDSAWELIAALDQIGIKCRAGVHHGIVRLRFNPIIGRQDIAGTTVHVAARLEPEADPGSVLVSDDVRTIALAQRIDTFVFKTKEITFGKAAGKFSEGDKYVASIALRKPAKR